MTHEIWITELENGYSFYMKYHVMHENKDVEFTEMIRETNGFRYPWIVSYINIRFALNLPKLSGYTWSVNEKGQKVGYWTDRK